MKRILIVLLMCTLLCGCMKEPCTVRVHQEFENVVRIELLNSSDQTDMKVMYTLDEAEHQSFWNDLHTLTFLRYHNDPPTSYGPISVRIYYRDGYIDIIGRNINGYYAPNGKNQARDGWYCVEDIEAFEALFAKYMKESTPEHVE